MLGEAKGLGCHVLIVRAAIYDLGLHYPRLLLKPFTELQLAAMLIVASSVYPLANWLKS
jgi:hypothetical protein